MTATALTRVRASWALGTLAAASMILAGCGGGGADAPAAESIESTVIVELRFPLVDSDTPCAGALDYASIKDGSTVTFRDAGDEVIGTAQLPDGEMKNGGPICTWEVDTQLDTNTDFVTAELGGWTSEAKPTDRGFVTFRLDTVLEQPEGGSKPEVDPTWTRK